MNAKIDNKCQKNTKISKRKLHFASQDIKGMLLFVFISNISSISFGRNVRKLQQLEQSIVTNHGTFDNGRQADE